MAEPAGSDLKYLSPTTAGKRQRGSGVSSGWAVMLLSGLVAAVLFLLVSQDSSQRFTVAVVGTQVNAGQPISTASLKETKIAVDKAQLDKLVQYSDIKKYEGWIAANTLGPGDILNKSSLRAQAAGSGLRSMSIPIDKTHANGGNVHPGDRVDIIDENASGNGYVAQGVEVLTVNDSNNGSALAGQNSFSVTVAVQAQQALQIAQAIKGGKFDIILATGAAPPPSSLSLSSPTASGTTPAADVPSSSSNNNTTPTSAPKASG